MDKLYIYNKSNNLIAVTAENKSFLKCCDYAKKILHDFGYDFSVMRIRKHVAMKKHLDGEILITKRNIFKLRNNKIKCEPCTQK